MWSYVYSDELYHHGIKGQRWGIRRFQNKDGSLTPLGKKRVKENSDNNDNHDDYQKAHSKTSVKTLSDKELRDRVNRLNMEKQYKDLTAKKESESFISKTIKAAGTVATITGTALTIYNNLDKIAKIAKSASEKASK